MSFAGVYLDKDILKAFLVFSLVFMASTSLLFVIRKIAFGLFRKWAQKTGTKADDYLLDSISHPSIYWVVAIGLYIALDTSHFPQKYVNYGLSLLTVLIILSITIAIANITSRLAQGALEKSAMSLPVTGLSRTVIKAVIYGLGALIILNSVGVSITPILTALGVGGLAVALALQDTLSNLFAGFHILVEKPLRVGDYIKLNTGEEGYVVDIGWRTTRIRQLANNFIIIPNNKLSQSIITNYYYPEKKMSLLVNISVSYDCDPDEVERALVEEATRALGEVPGLLADPAPFVRFIPGFGESSLNFTLICQIAEYTDQYLAQHELRKRILKRFRTEGIVIPYPVRTIEFKKRSPAANP